MNSVQKNSQIRNFCTEFLHFARSAKITAFCMVISRIFVFFSKNKDFKYRVLRNEPRYS
jgi:hypothetical protein